MNYRIVETNNELPDILLCRDRDENGQEKVIIFSIGFQAGSEDCLVEDEVLFPDMQLAQTFVRDFTQKAAIEWCEKQSLTYNE